jgi:hypothetical protein
MRRTIRHTSAANIRPPVPVAKSTRPPRRESED